MPLFDAVSGHDPSLVEHLKKLAPDVICVPTFPWLLGEQILRIPSRSALNILCSLLPRHRGPNPLLWTYYHNDQRTGVTVHYMNQRADASNILAKEAFDLHRGFAVNRRHEPMQDTRKKEVRYCSVLGYTPEDCQLEACQVSPASFGWSPYCRDGSVQLGDS